MSGRKDSIAILGVGKVGTAVGFLLKKAGYEIAAIASRSPSSVEKALPYTGGRVCSTFAEAAALARCILITTTDDTIANVCKEIVQAGVAGAGKKVVHMSGAGDLDLLDCARKSGAWVASIHPIQSFADVQGAIHNFPGSTFGVVADAKILNWCFTFVQDLGGHPFAVPEGSKPLYHAAACIASNYLVSLVNTAQNIYESIGLSSDEALRAFWPLVKGTIKNIEERGSVQALTGPISRGDVQTVRSHLKALAVKCPALVDFYRTMAQQTLQLGLKKGTLTGDQSERIKDLLERGGQE